jgi:glycosyltransferase involved in cell wall biosynthesis
MMLVRSLELSNVDRVIALKFPAYLIRHEHKTLWLLHQYRQAYDLFDAGQSNLPPGEAGQHLRDVIKRADDQSFAEARHIFTNSGTTRDRLKKYNGFDAEVLFPPINDPELFKGGAAGDYIFAGGRVNSMKRQHLLVEAMVSADPGVRLVIAGPPDTTDDRTKLERRVAELGLSDRVRLDLRFLPRREYADYINGAAGVAYLPFDEDSLGYVAMEGATAGKALISTSDSGGVLGLVRDGETGYVAAPDAPALAEAMSTLWRKRARAAEQGAAARALWMGMDINWQATVEALMR